MLWFVRMSDEVVELDADEERGLDLALAFDLVRLVVGFGSFVVPASFFARFDLVAFASGALGDSDVAVSWAESSSVL